MILFLDASKFRYDIRPGRPRRMRARVSMRACRQVWPRLFWFSTWTSSAPWFTFGAHIHLWRAWKPVLPVTEIPQLTGFSENGTLPCFVVIGWAVHSTQ